MINILKYENNSDIKVIICSENCRSYLNIGYSEIEISDLKSYLLEYNMKKYVLNKNKLEIELDKNCKVNKKIFFDTLLNFEFYYFDDLMNTIETKIARYAADLSDYILYVGMFNFKNVVKVPSSSMPVYTMNSTKLSRIINDPIYNNEGYIRNYPDNHTHDTYIPILNVLTLLGCFITVNQSYLDEVKELKGFNIGDKVILICEENIENLVKLLGSMKKRELMEYFDIEKSKIFDYTELYNKKNNNGFFNKYPLLYYVFCHEFGHAVFDCVNSKYEIKKEKQANYFASLVFNGCIDKYIELFTKKISKTNKIYKDIILVSDINRMKKKKYEEEVNVLFRLD